MSWLTVLHQLENSKTAAILITVIQNRGSTPRNSGTKMIVTRDTSYETIGGGHLEYQAIKKARIMLDEACQDAVLETYALGASLGQCCGGSIQLFFEPINPQPLHIALFGSGHVAKALLPLLNQLPCQITLIDSREEQLPVTALDNVTLCLSDDPTSEVNQQATNTLYLVMTHNHQLDQSIIEAVLNKGDARFIGMIGSTTKRRKFEHRLRHKGFKESAIQQLICPVGLENIKGKLPIEIAISIAGQIIQIYQTDKQSNPELKETASVHKLA